MQEFEALGYWYLPDNPSREIPGTLRFSPTHGLTLSLSGTFRESLLPPTVEKHPIIHGVTNESPYGRMFTLVDCFRSGASLHMPGFATEEIHANSAYAGDRLLRDADLRFDEFRVCFSDLANWIRLTGIRTEWPKQSDALITFRAEYCKPEEIRLTFAGRTLSFQLHCRISTSGRSLTLREKVALCVTGLEQLAIDEIRRRYLQPLHNFFTFAADSPNAVDDLVVLNTGVRPEGTDRPSAIYAIGQPVYVRPDEDKPRDAGEMLFTYDDVSDFFGHILGRWMNFCEKFAPFCRIYFGAQYSPGTFVEERFMSAVRALTLLFKDTTPASDGIAQAINEMTEKLARSPGERRLHRANEVVPIAAEVEFPWCLSEALSKYEDLLGGLIAPDIEHFVDAIVATRRYVSCPDGSPRPNVLQGSDLHWTTEKLNSLIKICVLDWLEFPRDLVAGLLNRNASFRHLKSVPPPQTG